MDSEQYDVVLNKTPEDTFLMKVEKNAITPFVVFAAELVFEFNICFILKLS